LASRGFVEAVDVDAIMLMTAAERSFIVLSEVNGLLHREEEYQCPSFWQAAGGREIKKSFLKPDLSAILQFIWQ
jgi:hypothetical protein